jgi:outer membrane protein assembly factor BamB
MRPATNQSRSCDPEAAVFALSRRTEEPEELLTGGGWPRWARAAGALVILAAVAALLVGRLSSSTPAPAPSLPLPTVHPSPAPVIDAKRAYDVVMDGTTAWSIEGNRLVRSTSGQVMASSSLAVLHVPAAGERLLALDPERHVIWLVLANAVPTLMIEFDSRTLRAIVRRTWSQVVSGAAAVNGYLYLANDFGVAELSAYAVHPRIVAGLRGAVGPITADPADGRLIALDVSNPVGVWSYRHGQRPYEATERLGISQASVAVADGHIWVGGYGPEGAMLFELSPRTLLAVASRPFPALGRGAVVVAGGRKVIWVRSASASSDLLECIDARTGRIEQQFHLTGYDHLASTSGDAVVATDAGVLNLALGNCAG